MRDSEKRTDEHKVVRFRAMQYTEGPHSYCFCCRFTHLALHKGKGCGRQGFELVKRDRNDAGKSGRGFLRDIVRIGIFNNFTGG